MIRITQARLKKKAGLAWLARVPSLKVRIISGGYYWLPQSAGYTSDPDEAEVLTLAEAWGRTAHYSPEKNVIYEIMPSPLGTPITIDEATIRRFSELVQGYLELEKPFEGQHFTPFTHILDLLYFMGISIDKKRFQGCMGFGDFKKIISDSIDPK